MESISSNKRAIAYAHLSKTFVPGALGAESENDDSGSMGFSDPESDDGESWLGIHSVFDNTRSLSDQRSSSTGSIGPRGSHPASHSSTVTIDRTDIKSQVLEELAVQQAEIIVDKVMVIARAIVALNQPTKHAVNTSQHLHLKPPGSESPQSSRTAPVTPESSFLLSPDGQQSALQNNTDRANIDESEIDAADLPTELDNSLFSSVDPCVIDTPIAESRRDHVRLPAPASPEERRATEEAMAQSEAWLNGEPGFFLTSFPRWYPKSSSCRIPVISPNSKSLNRPLRRSRSGSRIPIPSPISNSVAASLSRTQTLRSPASYPTKSPVAVTPTSASPIQSKLKSPSTESKTRAGSKRSSGSASSSPGCTSATMSPRKSSPTSPAIQGIKLNSSHRSGKISVSPQQVKEKTSVIKRSSSRTPLERNRSSTFSVKPPSSSAGSCGNTNVSASSKRKQIDQTRPITSYEIEGKSGNDANSASPVVTNKSRLNRSKTKTVKKRPESSYLMRGGVVSAGLSSPKVNDSPEDEQGSPFIVKLSKIFRGLGNSEGDQRAAQLKKYVLSVALETEIGMAKASLAKQDTIDSLEEKVKSMEYELIELETKHDEIKSADTVNSRVIWVAEALESCGISIHDLCSDDGRRVPWTEITTQLAKTYTI